MSPVSASDYQEILKGCESNSEKMQAAIQQALAQQKPNLLFTASAFVL